MRSSVEKHDDNKPTKRGVTMPEQENEVQAEAQAEATATTETQAAAPAVAEVNLMEVAAAVYLQVHSADPKLEKPRKEFIKIMTETHGMTQKGAASYYQMQKMEAEGKGKYKHHNKKKAKAPVAEAAPAADATAATDAAAAATGADENAA